MVANVVLGVGVAYLDEPFAALHGHAAMLTGLRTGNRMHIFLSALTTQ